MSEINHTRSELVRRLNEDVRWIFDEDEFYDKVYEYVSRQTWMLDVKIGTLNEETDLTWEEIATFMQVMKEFMEIQMDALNFF